MSLNRYRLQYLVRQKHRGAQFAARLLGRKDRLLGVILLCNNFANAAAATLMTLVSVEFFGEGQWVLALGTVIITFAILVFSEVSPKMVASAYPEQLAFASSYLLYPLLKILSPVVWFINLFVSALIRLLGIKLELEHVSHPMSMEELREIVAEAGDFIPGKHRSILLNLFDLEDMTVDDVMTAHTYIEILDFDVSLDEIVRQVSDSVHTRLPVRKGDNEEIIGILHVRKVISLLREGRLTAEGLQHAMVEPYFIPAGTSLYTQIQQFQELQQDIALVVDEYGELKGLVTLEDILDEVIGDFSSRIEDTAYQQQPDGSWLVEGMSNLRDLNRKLGLKLPTDGPRTLNGLVLEHFQDIPEPGTSFLVGSYPLEIVQAHDRIVQTVRIYPARPKKK